MLRNYLKIALRNLSKRKGFTFINVTGLAVGMACCLLIALYVRHELRYDRFHERAERIYRVATEVRTGGETWVENATVGVYVQQQIGWKNRDARFAFYYFLQYPDDNKLIVQRGRFAGWNKEVVGYLWRRMLGKK